MLWYSWEGKATGPKKWSNLLTVFFILKRIMLVIYLFNYTSDCQTLEWIEVIWNNYFLKVQVHEAHPLYPDHFWLHLGPAVCCFTRVSRWFYNLWSLSHTLRNTAPPSFFSITMCRPLSHIDEIIHMKRFCKSSNTLNM